jgi:hypothetical protein
LGTTHFSSSSTCSHTEHILLNMKLPLLLLIAASATAFVLPQAPCRPSNALHAGFGSNKAAAVQPIGNGMAAIKKQAAVFEELKVKEKAGFVLVRVKGSGEDWFKVRRIRCVLVCSVVSS